MADGQVAASCLQFAHLYTAVLHQQSLRYDFLLHLFNLWDNSLLRSSDILKCESGGCCLAACSGFCHCHATHMQRMW